VKIRRAVAILGPGGVGGLLAGALERAGTPVIVIARQPTAEVIRARGLRVESARFGELTATPRTVTRLTEPVDFLVVATKASGLRDGLERVAATPGLVVPLLNGLDHLATLRERFGWDAVAPATIRVEADRPEPGVVVHTSPFLRVDLAAVGEGAAGEQMAERVQRFAALLDAAGVPVRVGTGEAEVMWDKLVRLNALACTTSAFDLPLGEIRSTPELRGELIGAIEEGCAVASAEGAPIDPAGPVAELEAAHATLGSSMQRDIAAGREPELDAIPGAVLRAAARHHVATPTIARLVEMIAARAGVPVPLVSG